MTYADPKRCPQCGTAIKIADITGRYAECASCRDLWDVADL
jgi:ribosomal protein S27AE